MWAQLIEEERFRELSYGPCGGSIAAALAAAELAAAEVGTIAAAAKVVTAAAGATPVEPWPAAAGAKRYRP